VNLEIALGQSTGAIQVCIIQMRQHRLPPDDKHPASPWIAQNRTGLSRQAPTQAAVRAQGGLRRVGKDGAVGKLHVPLCPASAGWRSDCRNFATMPISESLRPNHQPLRAAAHPKATVPVPRRLLTSRSHSHPRRAGAQRRPQGVPHFSRWALPHQGDSRASLAAARPVFVTDQPIPALAPEQEQDLGQFTSPPAYFDRPQQLVLVSNRVDHAHRLLGRRRALQYRGRRARFIGGVDRSRRSQGRPFGASVFDERLERGGGFTAGGAHDLGAVFDIEGKAQASTCVIFVANPITVRWCRATPITTPALGLTRDNRRRWPEKLRLSQVLRCHLNSAQ